MPVVELLFSPLPAHVRTARLVAASVVRRAGADESLVDVVRLAVGEACARAVRCHATAGLTGDVTLTIDDGDGQIVATVSDRGPAAEEAVEAPDLAQLLVGGDTDDESLPDGFRLAVVSGLVDDVSVSRQDGATAVRMRWQLDGAGAAHRPSPGAPVWAAPV